MDHTYPQLFIDKEYLFGDGPPHWCEGNKPAPTAAEASDAHDKFLAFCRRHRERWPELDAASDSMDQCEQEFRCLNPNCSLCRRAFKRWMVTNIAGLLSTGSDGPTRYVCATIIPTKFSANAGRDRVLSDYRRALSHLEKTLVEAGITFAAGGWDFSYSTDLNGVCRLVPHVHLFFEKHEFELGEEVIRMAFPIARGVARPVYVKPFDGDPRGIAYAFKTEFGQRKSYLRNCEVEGGTGVAPQCNTRDDGLLVKQRVELAVLLKRIEMSALGFFMGVDIGFLPDDECRLIRL